MEEPEMKGKMRMELFKDGKITIDIETLSLSDLATLHFEFGSFLNEKFAERRKGGA